MDEVEFNDRVDKAHPIKLSHMFAWLKAIGGVNC